MLDWTPDRDTALLNAFEQGLSRRQMVAMFGYSMASLRKRASSLKKKNDMFLEVREIDGKTINVYKTGYPIGTEYKASVR